ncbi:hypothetical protein GYMLUDRAFT_60422 [Collybiopsis luxurians FD-317 M1]|uniref:Uncharacterized protein n=1 Tax=Collybiopsis luxurians FD-317 M1 TaxID=944289 RepID=A0A0D0BTV9_9AGAR|nr:hypothetical protein GYMLUDRAFT_60422 [Collybiopsis luxurians FD-317 M1]
MVNSRAYSGALKQEPDMNFGKMEWEIWKQHIHPALQRFCKKVYSMEDCHSWALKPEQQKGSSFVPDDSTRVESLDSEELGDQGPAGSVSTDTDGHVLPSEGVQWSSVGDSTTDLHANCGFNSKGKGRPKPKVTPVLENKADQPETHVAMKDQPEPGHSRTPALALLSTPRASAPTPPSKSIVPDSATSPPTSALTLFAFSTSQTPPLSPLARSSMPLTSLPMGSPPALPLSDGASSVMEMNSININSREPHKGK